MPRFLAAVIGLAAIFSAYAAEVFRGAYLAIPVGQIEAATACGMSDAGRFFPHQAAANVALRHSGAGQSVDGAA